MLLQGLDKIKNMKTKINNFELKEKNQNKKNLAWIFDLESSLISAEATIISSLERNESRGSHQKSDFPETNSSFKYNCMTNCL